MQVERISKNVHRIEAPSKLPLLIVSDVHFDSLKCDRKSLFKHFDQIKKSNGQIIVVGDWFDVMGAYKDPRSKSADIDPRYIRRDRQYIDLVVEDSYEQLRPYKQNLLFFGYGNHECYHTDTEVLTDSGWINIKDVTTNHLVATFDADEIYYEHPNATVSKEVESFYKIEGQASCQKVSGKHSVVLNDLTKINAEDIKDLRDKDLPSGMIEHKEEYLDNSLVKLLTAVVMDGTIVDRSKYGKTDAKRIQFKISKPKKIDFIKSVLDELGIAYTFKKASMSPTNKLQPYYIRIYGDHAKKIYSELNGLKELPEYFAGLGKVQFEMFLNTLVNTDGYQASKNTVEWNTTSKKDVDIVQMMATLNGYLFSYKENLNGSGFDNGKKQYRCRIQKEISNNRKLKIEKSEGGMSYCLNMPSGRFITRFNGKVAFSGNTSILKHRDTDPLERLIFLLNMGEGKDVHKGAYAGWLQFRLERGNGGIPFNVVYHHGKGGNAKRSKGILYSQLDAMEYPDANLIVSGHDHNKIYDPSNVRRRINSFGKTYKDTVHWLKTGSYKKSSDDFGWEVQKGFNAKRMGGWFVDLEVVRSYNTVDGKQTENAYVECDVREAKPLR